MASTASPQHTLPPAALAAALRTDQAHIAHHRPPSLLALHIPPEQADAVAAALWDEATDGPRPPLSILRLRYQGVLDGIKSALDAPSAPPPPLTTPSSADFDAALQVLEHLLRTPATHVTPATPLRDVLVATRTQRALGGPGRAAFGARPAAAPGRCYMCRYTNSAPHAVYKSLCGLCGSFTQTSSALSTAGVLDLRGRTALVTGGRVNLGFFVAVRLLRCGASVVVSSRYPLDAERRLRALGDFDGWRARVRVVGADFRRMRDAGALVGAVKGVLAGWGARGLDILVNNAAQTLTDSRGKEGAAVGRERALVREVVAAAAGGEGFGALQAGGGEAYVPRIRGGARENRILVGGPGDDAGDTESYHDEDGAPAPAPAIEEVEEEMPLTATNPQSSWTQRISEIPYQDIGDVLAINSFVPLLLIRELLPLMGSPRPHAQPARPAGYIINVSSREGLSEASPAASMKAGHHVHTNMSKAALNMLTETEAFPAWRDRRVAMNSVDPGFMSAADGSECPLGWEDGAARVLWCVGKGEVEGEAVWGRFLKHFGAAEAVVRGL